MSAMNTVCVESEAVYAIAPTNAVAFTCMLGSYCVYVA
jgi:hypothetical protein